MVAWSQIRLGSHILLLGDILMHRQNSTNRFDDMANAEDIIKGLTELDENSITVTFVSDKWYELPKSTSEQMTDVGLCQLDAKFE